METNAIKPMRKRVWLGIFACCMLCGCCFGNQILQHHIIYYPLRFCAYPFPSEVRVVESIRNGGGYGAPGIGEDGRVYEITVLECPRNWVVGTPKILIQYHVYENDELFDEGAMEIWMAGNFPIVPRFYRDYPKVNSD